MKYVEIRIMEDETILRQDILQMKDNFYFKLDLPIKIDDNSLFCGFQYKPEIELTRRKSNE